MYSKFCSVLTFGLIAGLWSSMMPMDSAMAQYINGPLTSVPAFSNAFSVRLNGAGYNVFLGPNGNYVTTHVGPYNMQQYVNFSNVPIRYGPMSSGYCMKNPAPWQVDQYSMYPDNTPYDPAQSINRKSDRVPMPGKNAKKNKKNQNALAEAKRRVGNPAEEKPAPAKPTPTPLILDANDKLPGWLVSGTEFIDRYVKAGEVSDALTACERLIDTRSGLPSDIYTRAAVLAFLNGRTMDEVAVYVGLGTTDGLRLSSRSLPGGSLEKYLSPAERRRFTERVAMLRLKERAGEMSDDEKKLIEVLLQL